MNTAKYGTLKKIFAGSVASVAAFYFWLYLIGNPLHDYLLLRNGKVTNGYITNTWEDATDDDHGRAVWTHGAEYSFRLPDSREMTGRSLEYSGRLKEEFANLKAPYPIEIEYYPNDPTISRIKGTGSATLTDWLWRKIGIGGALLVLFLSPGISFFVAAIREKYQRRIDSAA